MHYASAIGRQARQGIKTFRRPCFEHQVLVLLLTSTALAYSSHFTGTFILYLPAYLLQPPTESEYV